MISIMLTQGVLWDYAYTRAQKWTYNYSEVDFKIPDWVKESYYVLSTIY